MLKKARFYSIKLGIHLCLNLFCPFDLINGAAHRLLPPVLETLTSLFLGLLRHHIFMILTKRLIRLEFLAFGRLAREAPQQPTQQNHYCHETNDPQASFKPKAVLGFILLYPSLPSGFRKFCVLAGLNHDPPSIVRLVTIVSDLPEKGCAIVHSSSLGNAGVFRAGGRAFGPG